MLNNFEFCYIFQHFTLLFFVFIENQYSLSKKLILVFDMDMLKKKHLKKTVVKNKINNSNIIISII